MPRAAPPIDDILDALQFQQQLESSDASPDDIDAERVKELERYVEVMRSWGSDRPDAVQFFDVNQAGQDTQVLRLEYDTPSDLWRAVRRNINRDGVFVQTDQFPPIDTQLQLDIHVRGLGLAFSVSSKVIWVNPHARSGRPIGMGLKFQWSEPTHKDLFRAFMAGVALPQRLDELNWVTSH